MKKEKPQKDPRIQLLRTLHNAKDLRNCDRFDGKQQFTRCLFLLLQQLLLAEVLFESFLDHSCEVVELDVTLFLEEKKLKQKRCAQFIKKTFMSTMQYYYYISCRKNKKIHFCNTASSAGCRSKDQYLSELGRCCRLNKRKQAKRSAFNNFFLFIQT